MLSTHEVTAITEERAGTSMLSTHEVTAITEERAGTRPRRALSAVLCVDAGVPPGAPPGLAREVRNPTRRSMRWSGEADSSGCFAPPARLRGGATVESVVVAIRAGRNPRDVRGVGNTSSARLSFGRFVALPGSSMGSLRHRGTVPS